MSLTVWEIERNLKKIERTIPQVKQKAFHSIRMIYNPYVMKEKRFTNSCFCGACCHCDSPSEQRDQRVNIIIDEMELELIRLKNDRKELMILKKNIV